MQTVSQLESLADEVLERETNQHLDKRYPFEVELEPDDTRERLKECAQRCQDWLYAMKLAIDLGDEHKAWQALDELCCEANQMLEEMP